MIGRISAADELLVCLLRAVKNAERMPVINESNLISTCDHIESLVEQTRYQLSRLREEYNSDYLRNRS